MPQYFKAMATVAVWGLFIGAWLAAATNFIVGGIIEGYEFGDVTPPMSYFAGYAVCIGFAFAGGFMMLVRQKLE
jgi:hypothetical protein